MSLVAMELSCYKAVVAQELDYCYQCSAAVIFCWEGTKMKPSCQKKTAMRHMYPVLDLTFVYSRQVQCWY